ncbi:hypothetical protein, partial [Frankia sp. R82]|uniref:hypothetical protein n=1 Tax=Frankia sp. R82 TaxID=2950553 RepID=UPI0020443251
TPSAPEARAVSGQHRQPSARDDGSSGALGFLIAFNATTAPTIMVSKCPEPPDRHKARSTR